MNSECLGSIHILVVDDEEIVRHLLRTIFELKCFRITTVPDAKSALAALSEDTVDLIICDHFMPEMTGLELFHVVRELYPEIPFTLCSGSLPPIPDGVAASFAKPFRYDDLVSTVTNLLGI